MKLARRVGQFWYDFLVDGRPELLIGVILGLLVTSVAIRMDLPAVLVGSAFFAFVAVLGLGSIWYRARRRREEVPRG